MEPNEKTKKYLKELEGWVDTHKNNPQNRMENVSKGDQIVFLMRDEDDSTLFNFGLAEVLAVKNKKGILFNTLNVDDIGRVIIFTDSYPFNAQIEVTNIFRNYTSEERKNAKTKKN